MDVRELVTTIMSFDYVVILSRQNRLVPNHVFCFDGSGFNRSHSSQVIPYGAPPLVFPAVKANASFCSEDGEFSLCKSAFQLAGVGH